jgi:hypothetical protein
MALKKLIQTPFGVDVQDAYHRVENVLLISKKKIQFQVRTSLDGVKPHFNDVAHECDYDIEGENPIRQAYTYLKTLPVFDSAVDC